MNATVTRGHNGHLIMHKRISSPCKDMCPAYRRESLKQPMQLPAPMPTATGLNPEHLPSSNCCKMFAITVTSSATLQVHVSSTTPDCITASSTIISRTPSSLQRSWWEEISASTTYSLKEQYSTKLRL